MIGCFGYFDSLIFVCLKRIVLGPKICIFRCCFRALLCTVLELFIRSCTSTIGSISSFQFVCIID